MKWLRQLFCWHIYRINKTEDLNDGMEDQGWLKAEYRECIKCGHTKLTVGRYVSQ